MSTLHNSAKSEMDRMLQKAKELKEQSEQRKEQSLIPVVQEEVKVELPEVYKPISGLSLVGANEIEETKETLLAKVAIKAEDYQGVKLTPEASKRVHKSVGRLTHGASASVPMVCRGNDCSYKAKCVSGDTEILVDGLNTKQIKYITVGEYVYSVNPETLLLEKKKVLDTYINDIKPLYKVETESGSVLVTATHPFAYINKQGELDWITIQEGLTQGVKILTVNTLQEIDESNTDVGDCTEDVIVSITFERIDYTYDIEVEDNHNFIGNSFVLHNCPFYKENQAPEGESCLVEVMLAEYWTNKYLEDLNINPNSITEVHTLSRLVEIAIQENRVTMYMSIHEQDFTMDVITGFDDQGNPISNKDISNAFKIRESLEKSRIKLLETLSATRDKKMKNELLLRGQVQNHSSIHDMKNSVDDLIRTIKNNKVVNTIDVESK